MNFGAHISIEGGIGKAPKRAHTIGCECFQMFSRSPHGGKAADISKEKADEFKKERKKYKLKGCYIHTPYYINLASTDNRIYYGSISAIRKELEVADLIGAEAVVTHLGSARELGKAEADKKLVQGLVKIFRHSPASKKETKFKAVLLLEITAGAGEIMGDSFEEISNFIKETEKEVRKNKLGVCFDTAHAFASGYDLRNEKAVKKTFDRFDNMIGLERLGLIHCNDSLADFGSHVDRHDNIGSGKIGLAGFEAILNDARLKNMDLIIETPNGKEKEDIGKLRSIIKKLR
ncbi:MAG: deoxyribonuclease IV [Candidatus Paceibacterota bacterium]|jgi:deoxyribonuclease-4